MVLTAPVVRGDEPSLLHKYDDGEPWDHDKENFSVTRLHPNIRGFVTLGHIVITMNRLASAMSAVVEKYALLNLSSYLLFMGRIDRDRSLPAWFGYVPLTLSPQRYPPHRMDKCICLSDTISIIDISSSNNRSKCCIIVTL